MARILIAEDEARIASFVEKGLRLKGFTTVSAGDGAVVASLARDADFDLLILDLGLPGMDGLEVRRTIRERGERLPVIVLTAREGALVDDFELGTDDYMEKPFAFEELLARVQARLKTHKNRDESVLRSGELTLNLLTRRATLGDREVELTAREFTLLEVFMEHPDQVLSRDQLLLLVWDYDFDPGSNVVEVYVRALRKKLGDSLIETVRGAGYRFVMR